MRKHSSLRHFAALFLCVTLLVGVTVLPARAEEMTTKEKADVLFSLGLFKGKGTLEDGSPDYAL